MIFRMIQKSGPTFLPLCHKLRVWQTDGRTDGETDRILIARPRLHSMQCGNNNLSKMLLIVSSCVSSEMNKTVFYIIIVVTSLERMMESSDDWLKNVLAYVSRDVAISSWWSSFTAEANDTCRDRSIFGSTVKYLQIVAIKYQWNWHYSLSNEPKMNIVDWLSIDTVLDDLEWSWLA